ncbi:MAG: hypothetical protein O7E52_09450, partial [Candidatus Poribacteria bacterium]|nr:hypothetical protein [Candidatus Poribacteria bacterium]
MRLIRNAKEHQHRQKKQASSTIFSQNVRYLFLLVLLLQFAPAVFLIPGSTLVWAQGFESLPRVIDSADEDSVFSPNDDRVQDTLIIGFVTKGARGDFRITIDVHGPGGIGSPDGVFDVDDDWVV